MAVASATDQNSTSIARAAFSRFVALLERIGDRPGLLRVLTYHRVDESAAQAGLNPGLISATPTTFREQMAYLAKNYCVVGMEEVLACSRGQSELPSRAVLLTFDDAYEDFAGHAWPVLRELGLPVTLFVPTAYPDRPEMGFWWDRLYHAVSVAVPRDRLDTPAGLVSLATPQDRVRAWRRLRDRIKELRHHEAMAELDLLYRLLDAPPPVHRALGWADLRRLAAAGVTLGAHTRRHPLLHRLPLEDACAEAAGSLADLRREVGEVLPIFAYPSGGCTAALAGALRAEGFELGFTTRRGINRLGHSDPLLLRRINIGRRTTRPIFQAQLLGLAAWLNRWVDLPNFSAW